MKVRRSLLVLAALLVPLGACGLIIGIDEHHFTAPDGATTLADGRSEVDAQPCTFGSAPPGAPPFSDEPSLPPIVFALSYATLSGSNPDGTVMGFDFDGVCSCDPRDNSAHDGGVSCTPPANALKAGGCDDDGGVDNAVAAAVDVAAAFGGNFANAAEAINSQIRCGEQTMVYTLLNYNGLANDSQVVLTGIQSNGIHEPQAGGIADASILDACGVTEEQFEGGASYPAKFDGTDVWSRPSGSSNATVSGYVRDFQLVLDGRPSATFANPSLPLLFGTRVLNIATPIVVARLVPLDDKGAPLDAGTDGLPVGKASSFRMEDGRVGGRASAADVLAASSSIRVAGAKDPNKAQLCDNLLQYCFVKDVICRAADTMKFPQFDFAGQPCDALTVTLSFAAVRAEIAKVERPVASSEGGCAENWNDGCPGDAAICPQ